MNNEIRSISNKMHERSLSSDKQEFGSFYLLRFLGAEINFEPNKCIVSLESVPPMFNPQGTLHGGIITTIMDISMGHLIKNEQSEIDVINEYLPKQKSEDETIDIVNELIKKHNLENLKDMGKLMGFVKKVYPGEVDMGLVGKIAKSKLGN